ATDAERIQLAASRLDEDRRAERGNCFGWTQGSGRQNRASHPCVTAASTGSKSTAAASKSAAATTTRSKASGPESATATAAGPKASGPKPTATAATEPATTKPTEAARPAE